MFSRQISIGTISFTCLILLGGSYDLILLGSLYDQDQQFANLQSSALLTRHNSALLIAYPGLHPTRVSCAVARYTQGTPLFPARHRLIVGTDQHG